MRSFRRVCVYCGSSNRVGETYRHMAREMGTLLASRGIEVVYGGGSTGLMGVVADAALAAGGRVIGIIPEKLDRLELGHRGLTELRIVDGMHTRKLQMAELSDAFVALPGGWGTLEELFEAVTWAQLNYHLKPVGVLNVDGYYDPLLAWADRATADGFVRPLHRGLLTAAATPAALLDALAVAEIPELGRWIENP